MSFQPITGTTTLSKCSLWQGALLVKDVATIQEALACGGILVYLASDPSQAYFAIGAAAQMLMSKGSLKLKFWDKSDIVKLPSQHRSATGTSLTDFELTHDYGIDVDAALGPVLFKGVVSKAVTGFGISKMGPSSNNCFYVRGTGMPYVPTDMVTADRAVIVTAVTFPVDMRTLCSSMKPALLSGVESDFVPDVNRAYNELIAVTDRGFPSLYVVTKIDGAVVTMGAGPKASQVTVTQAEFGASLLDTGVAGIANKPTFWRLLSGLQAQGPFTRSVTTETPLLTPGYRTNGAEAKMLFKLPAPGALTPSGLPRLVSVLFDPIFGYDSGSGGNFGSTPRSLMQPSNATPYRSFAVYGLQAHTGPIRAVGGIDLIGYLGVSVPGFYWTVDGQKADVTGSVSWADFAFPTIETVDRTSLSYEADLTTPEGITAAQTYTSGYVRPTEWKGLPAWRSYGFDFMDAMEQFCSSVMDRATDLAKDRLS